MIISKNLYPNQRGFTLVGVLVAVAVVAVVSLAVAQILLNTSYVSTSSQANYDLLIDLQEIKFLLKDPASCSLNLANKKNTVENILPSILYQEATVQSRYLTPFNMKGYSLIQLIVQIPLAVGPTPLNAPKWAGMTRLNVSFNFTSITGIRKTIQKNIPLYVEAANGNYTRCSTDQLPIIASNSVLTGDVGRQGDPTLLSFSCPTGQYLIGFKARASDLIYALGGICEDEAHLNRSYLPMAGDINNGTEVVHLCPGGEFVRGFAVSEAAKFWTGGKLVVRGVTLNCENGAIWFGGGGSVVRNCPSGQNRVTQYYLTVKETNFADPVSSLEMLCSLQ